MGTKGKIIRGILITISVVAAFVVGYWALRYIWANRENPKAIEIVGGSILLSLLLGSSTTLFSKMREKGAKSKLSILIWFIFSATSLCAVIAFLVYSSNETENIERKIPVTYLIDMNSMEIADGLDVISISSEANFVYRDAIWLLRSFKDASEENKKQVEGICAGDSKYAAFGITLFRDLTAILIPRSIAGGGEQGEMEAALQRGQFRNWEGRPHKSIEGKSLGLDKIQGEFCSNPFFGLKGWPVYHRKDMRLYLPKGTEICLQSDKNGWGDLSYVIKNDYLEIIISVYESVVGHYINMAVPDESAFTIDALRKNKMGPFKSVETSIYFDVRFNKLRKGYPEMKLYEQWANDLYALLERRFAWGQLPLLSYREVMERYYGNQTSN